LHKTDISQETEHQQTQWQRATAEAREEGTRHPLFIPCASRSCPSVELVSQFRRQPCMPLHGRRAAIPPNDAKPSTVSHLSQTCREIPNPPPPLPVVRSSRTAASGVGSICNFQQVRLLAPNNAPCQLSFLQDLCPFPLWFPDRGTIERHPSSHPVLQPDLIFTVLLLSRRRGVLAGSGSLGGWVIWTITRVSQSPTWPTTRR
jgi:hypothetical protein